MHAFTVAFLAAIALSATIRLWLALRHMRHIGAHRDRVPTEFADRISADAHRKAADYSSEKTRLGALEALSGSVLLLALTLGGGLQGLSDIWAGMLAHGSYAHGIALILSLALLTSIVELLFSLYRTFVIETKFGFNRTSLALYLADAAKSVLVGVLLGAPLLFCVLWLMARMGESWWLWVWATWVSFNLLVLAIYPTLIAPLFNRFTPLEDDHLRVRIESLLANCGFRSKGLFVMDSSRRSSHGNAYFTGFGKSRRIVIFDTLLDRLSGAEIVAVLAHELGHFARRHVLKRMAMLFAGSFALLGMLGWLIDKDWFYTALNVQNPSTAMALALFMLVVPVFTFPLQPLASMYSRVHEYQADQYAAEHAAPNDLIQALVKLYKDNSSTLTPDPLHSAWYDSHPPANLRIARLQALKASAAGGAASRASA
ncbi:MAG: M48 family metallopeptidase [Betaproteobacteria bacterium]|nr:M48 family metallopeptidase [Betaproteobacteria bacterium]